MSLADRMKERRDELGISQSDAVQRAVKAGHNVSLAAWRQVEQGRSKDPQRKTRESIAAALEVSEQTVRSWVTGKPVNGTQPATGVDQMMAQLDEMRDQVARVLSQPQEPSMTEEIENMTDDQKAAFMKVWTRFKGIIDDALGGE